MQYLIAWYGQGGQRMDESCGAGLIRLYAVLFYRSAGLTLRESCARSYREISPDIGIGVRCRPTQVCNSLPWVIRYCKLI